MEFGVFPLLAAYSANASASSFRSLADTVLMFSLSHLAFVAFFFADIGITTPLSDIVYHRERTVDSVKYDKTAL